MGKFKIKAKILVVLLVFLVIAAGVTFHEVTFGVKTIAQLYKERPGEIWFITLMSGIIASWAGTMVIQFQGTLKTCFDTNNQKNDIITAQGQEIILLLKSNAQTNNELMTKINQNTENDLHTIKRVGKLEDDVEDHTRDISILKDRVHALESKSLSK